MNNTDRVEVNNFLVITFGAFVAGAVLLALESYICAGLLFAVGIFAYFVYHINIKCLNRSEKLRKHLDEIRNTTTKLEEYADKFPEPKAKAV